MARNGEQRTFVDMAALPTRCPMCQADADYDQLVVQNNPGGVGIILATTRHFECHHEMYARHESRDGLPVNQATYRPTWWPSGL